MPLNAEFFPDLDDVFQKKSKSGIKTPQMDVTGSRSESSD
jgi:hypothetical protein